MTKKNIAIIGTFDTKCDEVFFMEDLVKGKGCNPILIDVGPLTPSRIRSDFSNKTVAGLAGWRLSELIKIAERDQMMAAMGEGASKILLDLLKKNQLDGVIGIGGNQGTAIASVAIRSLPLGFPKFIVSTVASGNMRPYIGHKDICIMFSVSDLLGGPNPVSRSILSNAVSGVIGMAESGERITLQPGEKTVAVTALGNTEAAAHRIMELLRKKGFQVITFHASGAGGSAMEELIDAGVFSGIIDLTPHEISEEVVGEGAYVPVTPGRLKAAGRAGIPQVVSTGALEYVCFGPYESIPTRLRRRKIYLHNPYNANVKLSQSEMSTVGRVMAERLNESNGPVEILVPLKGWSIYGSKGGPLFDPQGNIRLLKALKRHLKPQLQYTELNMHINDQSFADACVDSFMHLFNGDKNE